MRYRVSGFTIRSENSAKPAGQASQYLTRLLKRLGPMQHALDFGCGKLRYTGTLAKTAKRVTVVDSAIQMDRVQIVCGRKTTVRQRAEERWNHVRALDALEFEADKQRFDFALCANVLSAIPVRAVRIRAIGVISNRLRKGGHCLFVCQYTNSDFCRQMRTRSVVRYADGYIKGVSGNASFYGIIRPEELVRCIRKGGMRVTEAWRHDQSAYAVAEPQ